MTSLPSVELVKRLQAGDGAAAEELFRRYVPRVRRIVRIRGAARGLWETEVEDLVQDTCFAAARSIEGFEPKGEAAILHWLARIAESRLVDRLRARREVAEGGPSSVGDSTIPPGPISGARADTTAPPEKVGRAERDLLLDACIAELGEREREVIVLRLMTGLSWNEVAVELGCASAEAARKLYARACRELGERARARGIEG